MNTNSFRTHRRIPAYAVLALLALAAALVFWPAPAHGQGDGDNTPTVNFSAIIPSKSYTAGTDVNAKVPPGAPGDPVEGYPKLPEATLINAPANTVGWDVAYTATNLPDGLTLGEDRVIYGAPTTANASAVTVTYTATVSVYVDPDADGEYDDLTTSTYTANRIFQVTVAPAVTFSAEARKFFGSRIISWKSGTPPNGGWGPTGSGGVNDAGLTTTPTYSASITFPAATGGSGTLTYKLLENRVDENNANKPVEPRPLSEAASGITFDSSTRALGGTPAGAARKTWAVIYVAEDENGSFASGYLNIYAGGYGGL